MRGMSFACIDVVQCDLTSAMDLNQAFANAAKAQRTAKRFCAHWFETPLGAMMAIADTNALHMLAFFDQPHLASAIVELFGEQTREIAPGKNGILASLELEMSQYFSGALSQFRTPIQHSGTAFQMAAWQALIHIPYGETRSYQEQAASIGNANAYRAVANANACNKIPVIVPCHRIIKSDGSVGGYGGRAERKIWLLDLERRSRRC